MAAPVSNLASMPSNLAFEDAAGVPLTALTAWQVSNLVARALLVTCSVKALKPLMMSGMQEVASVL